MKVCNKCLLPKPLSDFSRDKNRKDGWTYSCKKCRNKASKLWRDKHPKNSAEYCSRWRKNNPEKNKQWYANNKEKKNSATNLWRSNNHDKVCKIAKKGNAKRRNTAKGRLGVNIGNAICQSLCGLKGGRHWETLVGFTLEQLKRHLEKKFTPEMNWENYGTYWHIDHKIPQSVFNYKSPEDIDFRKCWGLKNLQPLEKKQNIRKSNKLTKPFQPSLAIVC